MRLSEFFSAKFDFDKNLIIIKMDDKSTKKHSRTIPFLPQLISLQDTQLINELSKIGVQVYFRILFKTLSMPPLTTIHSFRHTFASMCNHIGINNKQIQVWLGHAQFSTTMDIYTNIVENNGTSFVLDYLKLLKNTLNIQ